MTMAELRKIARNFAIASEIGEIEDSEPIETEAPELHSVKFVFDSKTGKSVTIWLSTDTGELEQISADID